MVIPCLSHFQGSCNERFFFKASFPCMCLIVFVQLCHRIEQKAASSLGNLF